MSHFTVAASPSGVFFRPSGTSSTEQPSAGNTTATALRNASFFMSVLTAKNALNFFTPRPPGQLVLATAPESRRGSQSN
ncbi:hypothetical protein D3C83_166710 [compost metagenome]